MKVGPKKKKVIAEEEIQEEPLVATHPSSGSRPATIRPSRRKAQRPKAEVKKKAEAAEAEAKKKAESAARLEAKKKAEAEDRKRRELQARKQTGEHPLIGLDWHRTLSFDDTNEGNHGVSERTVQLLREIQDWGFDLSVHHQFCFQPRHSTSGCPACR